MPTILVADDDPALMLLACASIQQDGYQLLRASGGQQAWSLIQQHRPLVAVMDSGRPARSGIDLCRLIRDTPELADTGLVLLSTSASLMDVWEGLAAGADAYLTKPFSPEELRDAVESLLPRGGAPGTAALTGAFA